jgi:serine/threonine-protein kinase
MVPFVVSIVLLVTVGLAASAFARVNGAATIAVPGLVGRTLASATALAKHEGLSIGSTDQKASSDPKGVVVKQSPPAGSFTSARKVNLVLSSGPPSVAIPTIAGRPWSTAQKALDAIGFAYGSTSVYNDKVPTGDVISVTPAAGKRVAPDAELVVVLSKGHAPVAVPTLVGKTFKQASDALKALGLKTFRGREVYNNDIPAKRVVRTIPGAGQDAPFGSQVTVTLSKGPIMTTVPALLGLSLAEAQGRLDLAHLQFTIDGAVRGGDVVVDQNVPAGKKVPMETTTIILHFGRKA